MNNAPSQVVPGTRDTRAGPAQGISTHLPTRAIPVASSGYNRRMPKASQVSGGIEPAGTVPRPARRAPTPPPGPGARRDTATPRQTGARTLLSGVFALVAFVGVTVALLAVLVRVLKT